MLDGMAAVVGLIIDDAIVMIEQIIRRVRQAGIAGTSVLAVAAEFPKPLAGSVSAVFIGLWITGIELNISAMMGMTMIVGIVTEVAIFFFTEFVDLAAVRPVQIALIEAGQNRMRPIVMTTLAAILTLLALAIGQGSSMQQPLAAAIISGLVVQLPLVLLVVPSIFLLLHRPAVD
jgi:multidrug efflux pump subunit AcrB